MVCLDSNSNKFFGKKNYKSEICKLENQSFQDSFFSAFENYNNDYEYTSKGVLRKITPPTCSNCDTQMNHNGYNTYTKKNLGSV
ncbi:MAG: hypothetical protein KKA38_03245, partial [Euryarchaeota archaeon]|nr:hypothetical protein [Euryarchaeota archaeon]